MTTVAERCGWRPDPAGVEQTLADIAVNVTEFGGLRDELQPSGGLPWVKRAGKHDELWADDDEEWQLHTTRPDFVLDYAAMARDQDPIILAEALIETMPRWRRGRQGIGDCVSWGWEMVATCAAAWQSLNEPGTRFRGEYATEPIYGGSRVEARGRRTGGWSDGSYGGAAAKWSTDWGCLLRADLSAVGSAEYDLRQYDSQKAKNWGHYGCGGKNDASKLDQAAKDYPLGHCVLVTNFDDAALAIANGYPIAVCSMYGFGSRGRDGFAPHRGSWAHCMCFVGVRFDQPGLLCMNSWGNSWGTKDPHAYVDHPELQKCTAWVSARDVNGMLRGRDSFAGGRPAKLERKPIQWEGLFTRGIGRRRRQQPRSLFAAA